MRAIIRAHRWCDAVLRVLAYRAHVNVEILGVVEYKQYWQHILTRKDDVDCQLFKSVILPMVIPHTVRVTVMFRS